MAYLAFHELGQVRLPALTLLERTVAIAWTMALRSSLVDPVTAEGNRLRYSGQASVNGKGGYRFPLAAIRSAKTGGKDRIHVRITHNEPGTGAQVVDYDNGRVSGSAGAAKSPAGQAAAGGEGGAVIEGRIGLGAD